MVQLFGPEDSGYLLHLTGKLIGMQYFDEIARRTSARLGEPQESSMNSCAHCSRHKTISPKSAKTKALSKSGNKAGS